TSSFLSLRPPPSSTLFPYTTLFRSVSSLNMTGGTFTAGTATGRLILGGNVTATSDATASALITGPGQVSLNGATRTFTVGDGPRSEEHTSELQSRSDLVCRLLLEKK